MIRGAVVATRAVLAFAKLLAACGSSHTVAQAPKLAPARPEAVSKLAEGADAAKDRASHQRALALFEQAVKVDGGLWEARYDLGLMQAEFGNLAAAERELKEAAALAPNAEDVVVALAEVRRRRGDARGAIAALDAFVKAHPDATVAPIVLMAALREGGQVEPAIAMAQGILVRHAHDPFALSELALAHLERGEIDTAELLSGEALKADPKSAVAERTAGLVALKQGDDASAFQHFTRASELDPNDTAARLNIGTVLLQAGVYAKAYEHFKAVHDADPEDVAAILGLAAARRGMAKKDDQAAYAEAEKLLQSALEKQPHQFAAAYNLAVLYADYMKRPNDAAEYYRRFLADAPADHPARGEAEKWLSAQKK